MAAKVSIIIPIYNVEIYLDECLESVKRQTLHDIEIICVNDGSKDNSLAIVKKYAENDSRFVIIDKENGGYGKAMNVGLDRATGEYIGIVEPDDYITLYMYEDLYKIAAENSLEMVKADFYRFTRAPENGDMSLVYNHLDSTGTKYNRIFDPSNEPEALRFIMNTWSGIYRREFLERFHIRHNETPGASFQDNGFFFQTFIYAKRAMIIDKPYYMNRRDNPNSSVNNREKVYASNIEYDYIREILMRDPEIWEKFKYMYSLKKFHNYNFTLTRIGDEFKREYIERISREFRRAKDQGELCESVFTKLEWAKLCFLMRDPAGYYIKHYLYTSYERALETEIAGLKEKIGELTETVKQECRNKNELSKEIKKVENSTTFRVGKIIMYIPVSLKRCLKKLFRNR